MTITLDTWDIVGILVFCALPFIGWAIAKVFASAMSDAE